MLCPTQIRVNNMDEFLIYFSVLVSLTIAAWIIPIKLKKKIESDFASNPKMLQPNGKKAFKLITINYIGATMFGKFRHHEIDSQDTVVSYYCICFLMIPLIPLGCYRVIDLGGSYYFYGSERMKCLEILCVYLDALKWALSFFVGGAIIFLN